MEAKALKTAAKEFNKVVILETPVVVKGNDNLEKDLYKALEAIEPEDKFTAETLAVFAELRAKYDKKSKADKGEKKSEKEDKKEKKVVVKAGDVVELDPHNSKIKKEKEMKKEEKPAEKPKKEKGEKPEVKIIRIILDRKVNKETLEALLKEEEVFTSLDKKARKELKNETNFMSLKKKMLDVFDQDLVKELRAELPPIDKTPKADKAEKVVDNPVVNSIKSAMKMKQLKTIAKANDQFNWKKLKKLEDFEEIQSAMLKVVAGGGKEKKSEPAKPKMIPNPLIAEINAFEKAKKLRKWAEEMEQFKSVKKMKGMELDELQAALIKVIPAEIEEKSKKSGGATHEKRESNWDERKPFVVELIKEAAYTRAELMKKLIEKFPGQDKSHSNMLSEIKNEKYAGKYGLGKLVEENKNGCYRFVKDKK